MGRILMVFAVFFAIQSAKAQPPGDYLTQVCERNVTGNVLKKYKKSDRAYLSDYGAWDKKSKQVVGKYTGTFEVVVAIETQECYEGWEVETKIEYPEGSKTPSCKVKKITYKDRDCA